MEYLGIKTNGVKSMSTLLNIKKLLLAGLLITSVQIVHAQVLHFHERINTTPSLPVTIGTPAATKIVQVTPLLPAASYSDVSLSDKITLGVDHSLMNYFIPTAAVIKVTLQIERWDINNNPILPAISAGLTLNYQPFGHAGPYIDRTVYNFNDAYTYKITILAITENNVPVQSLQKNLFIDTDIFLERYIDFSAGAIQPISVTSAAGIDLDCDNIKDELKIEWASVPGAVEYQLEWTFINDYDLNPGIYLPLSSPVLRYDFRNNSTRITTVNNNYSITLVFEHGWLLYRVRGIGKDLVDPSLSVVGKWNAVDKGTVSSLVNRYHNQAEHEANKNWQYAATYAEEGKKKEVISYFDGSLRNRQSVTKINSDSNTIVGETIYDHQGRPAINVLPVPVINPACATGASEPSVKYYPNFNRNDANTVYSRIDFDQDASPANSCNPKVNGMSTADGASNYYSPVNPNKNGARAFVPDAEKFPFTQVEYTPDNTGRIRRQGGVGPEYQLGKNHETKYFYGSPNQVQLDRMFGSEVGDASHYKKNLVVDANGQVSVSYLDQEGRTIATSLAGNAPKDQHGTTILAPLASESTSAKPLTVDLFAKNANGKSNANTINVQRDAIVFNSQLLVAYRSNYEFKYDLEIDTLSDPCFKNNICFNCVYDLEIKVTDDCGQMVPALPILPGINPVKKMTGQFNTGREGEFVSFKTTCSPPTKFAGTETFTLDLPAGNYTVSKILTVNSEARYFYIKFYLDTINTSRQQGQYVNLKPRCVRTFQSFLDSAIAQADTASCNITCDDCARSLQTINGTYYIDVKEARDAFVAAGNGTALDFDYLLEECGAPCKEISVCETTYEMLLMDVSPDGQYAEFQQKADGSPPDMALSVLNTNNILPETIAGNYANWTNPKIKINGTDYPYYLEENGIRSTIHLTVIDDQQSITPANFSPVVISVAGDKVKYDATGGFYYTYPENLANAADFVARWTDNWAKSLVQYHPEYCYYESCIQYSQKSSPAALSSDEFDIQLLKTDTYADAVSKLLITSANSIDFSSDPFFNTLSPTNIITSFKYDFASHTSYSMMEMAAIAARCATQYGIMPTPGSPCTQFGSGFDNVIKDQEWNLLKNFYLSEKQKLQKQLADNEAILNCKRYNGCIGNPNYNPFISGMMSFGTFSNYFNSQAFKPVQPCSVFYASYYLKKKKRFNPETNLEQPSADGAAYQMYLQTGQCPLAINLQYLLGTLANQLKLANTAGEPLEQHPEFTQDLYKAVSGGTMPATFIQYFWKATTAPANDILHVNISSASSIACTIALDKTGTGIASWDDVVNISELKYTVTNGSNYEFTAVAAMANPPGTLTPFYYKTIKGSSCINITGCTFKNQCKANDLANDLSNLWSALKVNLEFTAPNVQLDQSPTRYKNFITSRIKNALGTTNNTLFWNYNSTDAQFELYDIADPFKKLLVKFTGFDPVAYNSNNLPNVAFSGIKGDNQNGFTVNGINAVNTTLVSITGTVNLVDNGITTPVNMGACGLPEPVLCGGDEYKLRNDLEGLLADVLVKKPFNPNTDITLSPKYTNLINAYIPQGVLQSTGKYDKVILNSNNDYKEQLYFNIHCVCKIILSHKGKGNTPLLFSNLVRFDNLTAYGEPAFDGNYYHFYALATYDLNGRKIKDTIFGESCLPLKNCIPSISTDTFVSPVMPYINPCKQYQLNVAHTNAANAYHQYTDSLTTEIARKYNEHCLSALENFTTKYTDKEYHFTLYYYDQAGNLVRTIPPEGVRLVPVTAPPILPIITPQTPAEMITVDRTNNTHTFFTDHTMATTYEYNSLNQLVRQSMPDHDLMDIWDYSFPNGLDNRLKITATQFVTATKGYLSGYVDVGTGIKRGYLYSTGDGGVTWTKMNGLVASDLKKIQMIDAFNGFAVGTHGIVLKTTNGGNDWDMISLNGISGVTALNDLFFTSLLNGIIIGDNGMILQTTDAGASFTSVTPAFTAGFQLNSITYDGSNLFIGAGNAGGQGQLYKGIVSNPAATSFAVAWSVLNNIRSTDLSNIQMLSSNNSNGFTAGTDGTLMHTTDGGTTWVTIATGTGDNFKKIYFKNNNEGVAILEAVAGQGQVYKTANGGVTWTLISDAGDYYNDFYFYQNDKGYAVTANGKVKRVVMNGSYGLVAIVTTPAMTAADDLVSVYFSDADHGWIANNSGTAYYTNNATSNAVTWQAVNTSLAASIKEIYFSNTDNSGIALMSSGALYRITQAGTTYTFALLSAPGDNYTDIDDNATYVYGFDKTSGSVKYVPKSNLSAGLTVYSSGVTAAAAANLVSLNVQVPNKIYTAGKNGDLLLGTANSWSYNMNTITPLAINDVQAAGTNNIYAVGNEGALLQTLNGGSNWKILPTATAVSFNAVKFNTSATTNIPPAYKGLIAGDNGLLLKSTVTGTIVGLSAIPLTTSEKLNDIALNVTGRAYIAGAHGTLAFISDIQSPLPVIASLKPSEDFLGISFIPSSNAVYVVGDNSAVYNYNNASGAKVKNVFTPKLNDVHFTNIQNGYTVGEKGTVRHTADGGISWQYVAVPATVTLNGIWTTQPGKAVMIGDNGYNANITGTTTVVNNSFTTNNSLYDIAVNNGTGYMVGAGGSAYKTADNGITWSSIISTLTVTFRAIHIFQNNNFMAVGEDKIYCYNGTSWIVQNATGIPAATVFNDVYFHDDRNGYVAGTGGILLKCALPGNIFALTSSNSVVWETRSLSGINGVPNPAQVNITTIDFSSRYNGFIGGIDNSSTANTGYARLLNDESNIFSTRFWYDRLGRMVISQNTKQFRRSKQDYSYTLYDELGRIKEVGEKTDNAAINGFATIFGTYINNHYNPSVIDDARLNAFIITGSRREVTRTYYDHNVITGLPLIQDNLRKRVASVTYEDVDDNNDQTCQHATHYSYDIHGNVKTLIQDNPTITIPGQRFKKIGYSYDLISGKVNVVRYQDGQPDAMYHFYKYDADNRITDVYTSTYPQANTIINDSVKVNPLWDHDAKYFYYAHGPLARVEVGDNKVQGIDYAYTLQGWIKGINSNSLKAENDIGNDGLTAGTNIAVAKDAFGYTLGYHAGDYKPIDALKWSPVTTRFEAVTTVSDLAAARYDLFNGNISQMVTTITEPKVYTGAVNETPATVLPQGSAYKYDQLNRLLEANAFTNIDLFTNAWKIGSTTPVGYHNAFKYDANGNITYQERADANGLVFDKLNYKYKTDGGSKNLQNRLYQVNETNGIADNGLATDDIDDQGPFNPTPSLPATINDVNNYRYDEIGNLKHDEQEEIERIDWTVYGKIKRIIRNATSTKPDLEFNYDAGGNRIAKIVKPHGSSLENGGADNRALWTTTYYARDAQGNIMTTYISAQVGTSPAFKLTERNIFGSSRLGMENTVVDLINPPLAGNVFNRTLGYRLYEENNHLGNVLAVVSDKKIPHSTNGTAIDYYLTDILTSQDYYSFGMVMKGRNFTGTTGYRYGFNGMEKDDKGCGCLDEYTTDYRQYDSRLSRWLSLDSKHVAIPDQSPYNFSNNTPIFGGDPQGDICIPCIFIIAGLLTAPSVAVAPTGRPSDAQAIKDAYNLQTKWLLFSLGSGGAIASKITFQTVAKEASKQFLTQFSANIMIQAFNKRKTNEKVDYKTAFEQSIKGLDFADAIIGKYKGAFELTKNIFSASIDITFEEATILGVDKNVTDVTVDFIINTIGGKISKQIPKTKYSSIIEKVESVVQSKTADAIKENIKEMKGSVGNPTGSVTPADETKIELSPQVKQIIKERDKDN